MVLPLLLGGTFAACNDDFVIDNEYDGPAIELLLDSNDSDTRALTGEQTPFTKEERQLNTVDLFFYRESGVNPDALEAPIKVESMSDKTHDEMVKVNLSEDEAKTLFGIADLDGTGSCRVFAVANVSAADYAAAGVDKATATVADLKKIKATTPEFAGAPKDFQGFALITKDPMGDVVSYSSPKAMGTVKLKNLAAKMDVFVKFATDLTDSDGNRLQVVRSKDVPTSEVHIVNGVTAVELNGFNKDVLVDTEENSDYYSIRVGSDDENIRRLGKLDTQDPFYDETNGWIYATSDPYYSYPNEWEASPLEQHRTSLILKVDWTTEDDPENVDATDVLTTYYSVPVDIDGNKLQSNRYYRLKLNINSLGGENIGEPLEIEGEWSVTDWGTTLLEGDLRETRYLEVVQTQEDRDGSVYTAVVNGNEMLIDIPFHSSHKTYIESVNVEFTTFDEQYSYNWHGNSDNGRNSIIYTEGRPRSGDINNNTIIPANFQRNTLEEVTGREWHAAYIDNIKKVITIRHKIGGTKVEGDHYVPDESEIYRYVSYKITIQLNHDNYTPGFGDLAKIVIMHHPSIYVEGEVNAGYNDYDYRGAAEIGSSAKYEMDRWKYGAAMHHHGFARINHNDPTEAKYGGLRGITKANGAPTNWGDNTTENPIMYIINVTQIEPNLETVLNTRFHLKDPRTNVNKVNEVLGNDKWYPADHFVNGVRDVTTGDYTPRYYYPTDETPVPENMYAIAPRFRIASCFGITPAKGALNKDEEEITLDQARKRCATYQEYGYPAGRWRLPTIGELKFVQYLSTHNLVPKVFQFGADYVTAFGVYRFPSNLQEYPNGSDGRVRCVYDDWYWVDQNGKPDNLKPARLDYDPIGRNVNIDMGAVYNNRNVFVWGDKEKRSPQTPRTSTKKKTK